MSLQSRQNVSHSENIKETTVHIFFSKQNKSVISFKLKLHLCPFWRYNKYEIIDQDAYELRTAEYSLHNT